VAAGFFAAALFCESSCRAAAREPRGSLTFGEYDAHLPFIPIRYFIVFDVPAGDRRGN